MSYAAEDEELEVTYPLTESIHILREKHRTVARLHQERFEQVKKLIEALESYSSHLEPSFLQIKLPPIPGDGKAPPPTFDLSPSYINSVDSEFTRVYEEYTKRVSTVQQLAEDVVKLWAELGTPQAQTDSNLVQCWQDSPEQLGLHQDDIYKLRARRERLQEEKRGRERKVKDLRAAIGSLWDRLNVAEPDRKSFLASCRGCGLRVINDLEDELSRLNELKRQNLHLFVEDARTRINTLWDELFFSEEEAVEFTPMFCDVYSDALLSAHESEISRLEALKEQRAPILNLVDKHRSLVKERDELAATSQDASRLIVKKGEKRDPTRLLREEKMRKRIARDLPKIEVDVVKTLERWEDEYGRPFLVYGDRYLEIIESSNSKAPPPRSKTPNGMAAPSSRGNRSATQSSRPGTACGETSTLRSKTPLINGNTLTRSNANTFSNPRPPQPKDQQKSPSRIPARAPLGAMPSGSNSPERQQQGSRHQTRDQENFGRTIRPGAKPDPRVMAPPPKMRNLHEIHSPPTSYPNEPDSGRSGSVVRSTIPDDPYSDHLHSSFMNRSQLNSSQAYPSNHPYQHPNRPFDDHRAMPPPPRPPYQRNNSHDNDSIASSAMSRQLSANSSVPGSVASSNTNATSENWETFGESEDEDEQATPGPERPMRGQGHWAQKNTGAKRGYGDPMPAAHAYAGTKKAKMRGMEVVGGDGRDGSESGWTDEGSLGSTY